MVLNKHEVIGLDIGSKRIGVARVNTIARIPEPLGILDVDGTELDQLRLIIDTRSPSLVVVGVPKNLSGEETAQSSAIRDWAEQSLSPMLADLDIQMHYSDESLSSVQARQQQPDKKHIDDYAACYILESYLATGAME